MTISSTTSRWEAVGNGSTTVFPYTNKIFADSDLKVYLDGALKALTTHYTVSGEGSEAGGNVTFVTAPASGVRVVIVRSVANTQLIDYPAGGSFPSVATEDGLDRRTIISQQISESAARSIQYLESDSNLPSGTLPALASLKGRYLKFNISSGAPEAGVFDSGTSVYTTQYLSGNGATTGFILSPVPTSSAAMNVYITGVHQDPTAYTLTGSTLTFSAAPPPGTDNILVQAAEEVPIGTTTSDFVTHQPLGTGAVTRTVQAALRTYMPTLEDFGGGTMVADNAAAFQAAMNAGGRLYVPFGNRYLIKSAITRTGALELVGGGSLVWTSDAASTGLTVFLTAADNYSDRVSIGNVQFRTRKAAVGTALTIDGTAQISGGVLQKRTFGRVFLTDTIFRGDNAPGVDGWLKHCVCSGVSNIELAGVYISGHLITDETTIASLSGIECDDQGNGAVMNLSRVSVYYCQDAVSYDGVEGVNIHQSNLVAVDNGVLAVNSNIGFAPQLNVVDSHINARVRGVDATGIQGVFVNGTYFWHRSSATATGAAVVLTNCDDILVEGNTFTANYASTGQLYYGALIAGTSTDVIVRNNKGEDVTFLAWAQTNTDKVLFENNQVSKESPAAPDPGLYANTTAGELTIDVKRRSGKSGSTVAAGSGTLVNVDMGTVHLGQTFLVTGKVSYTKGGTDGITTTAILKGAGTASVQFVHDDVELRHRSIQKASELSTHTVSGCMVVTGAGTLTLRCQFTSLGSNATIVAGEAQLAAIQLGTSGRLS